MEGKWKVTDEMYNPDEECEEMINTMKKICKQKGISPHMLAKEAGISTSTISYLMKRKTNPQVYTVLALCNVLGVRIGDLFDREGDEQEVEVKRMTYEENELLTCYRSLSDRKRELVRIYVDMLHRYDDEMLVRL